jgi:membrane-associated phospholipid phosphatase
MPLLLLAVFLNGNFDTDLSNAIRRDTSIHLLNTAMQGITTLGDARADAVINLGVFFLGNDSVARTVKLATVSWCASGVATTLIKGAVNRTRPDSSGGSRWDSSFPSGHTSDYFSIATVYALKYHQLVIPLYVVGAGVAFSRIYLGKHYATDVLGGAALGILTGWLTVRFEPQLRRIPFLR